MKILSQPWAPQTERDILQLNRWQFQRPKYYDMHARDLPTLKDDVVHTKQFQQESKEWKKSMILSKLNERSYMAETPNGDI